MIKYAMPDGFCIIESKTNKTAFYADVFGEYIEMPEKWAEKIVNLLTAGNYKKGLHFVDMVKDRSKRYNN